LNIRFNVQFLHFIIIFYLALSARKIVSSDEDENVEATKSKKAEKKKPAQVCLSSDENEDDNHEANKRKKFDNEEHKKAEKKKKKKKNKHLTNGENGSGGSGADDMDNEFYEGDGGDGSDSDSDAEMPETHKNAILALFNKATVDEIQSMINISAKRLETVLTLRPFAGFADLRARLAQKSLLSVIESAKDIIYARQVVTELLTKCEHISQCLDVQVQALNKLNEQEGDDLSGAQVQLKRQPKCLNEKLELKKYQLIGLNWLCLMYKENLNAILADEMGLGKTCQTIAFLAHLNETNAHHHKKMLHLIVVPPTTLDNWTRELSTWAPTLTYLIYQVINAPGLI
jgi:SWI/SNF-related matrix-associated actin-dependent regulator of chromatin subfamily A containing DEAD/H box 1